MKLFYKGGGWIADKLEKPLIKGRGAVNKLAKVVTI